MSAHGHKSDIEPVITDPTYEDRDLNLRALGVFGLVVFIVVVLTFLSMFGMFKVLNNSAADRVGEAPERVIPQTGPILQAFPIAELKKYEEKQEAYSKSFSWVDKTNQVVAIPLDLAMKIAHQTEFGADMSKLDLAHLPGAVKHHGHDHHGEKHHDGDKHHDGEKHHDGDKPHEGEKHGKEPPAEKPASEPKPEESKTEDKPKPEQTEKPEPVPEETPEPADKPEPEDKPEVKPAETGTDKPDADKPASDKPAEDKPADDKPAADKPDEAPAKKMTIGEMEKELRTLLKSEDQLIASLGEKHPKVLALREQIKTLKANMSKAVSAPAEVKEAPKAPKPKSIKDLLGE